MKNLFIRTFVVALGVIAASAVVAWSGPTGTAPDNNAPAPINTTATTQTKTGILSSGNSFVAPNMTANQFCIGTSCVTSWGQAGGSGFTGSGSTNYVTKFTGATALGNSSIFDNGNVGIGATDPGQKLDVNGYVRVRSVNGEGGTIHLMGNNGVNLYLENINGTFRIINSSWTAGVFNVDQSGNTTVNGSLTSAGQPVCLANGTNCPAGAAPAWASITGKPFNWVGQGGQPSWLWGSNDGANYYVWNPSNFSVSYAATAGNANALGGVGPAGYCQANGTNCPAGAAPAWASITGKPGNLAYWDSWYGSAYHGSDGNIYLGWLGDWLSNRLNQAVTTGASPTFGTVTATAFVYSSDRRLKDNIAPIQDALAKIVELRGVNFSWRSGARAGQQDVGVIAQEMQNVLPEAVHTGTDGYLSVDYPKLVPLLIQAIKEQQAQIEELKTQVDALRAGR